MKKVLFIVLFFLSICSLQAQITKYIINGIISDEKTGERVSNAAVQINGLTIGTVTNANGYFRTVIDELPKILYISHIAYEPKLIKNLTEYKNLKISLSPKIIEIEEVVVSGEKIKNIHVAKELWAFDYEFYENKIILLGFKKTLDDVRLILMRNWGDTISSIPFNQKVVRLKTDPIGNIHLETRDSTYQLLYYNNKLELLPPVSNKKFNTAFSTCKAYHNGNLYYQYSHYHNFITDIYYIDLTNNKTQKDLRIIRDTVKIQRFEREFDIFFYANRNLELRMSVTEIEKNLQLLRERQRFDWIDSTSRFSSMYVPFFKIGNQFGILNYLESRLEIYSEDHELTGDYPIDFHNDPAWEKDYFIDPVRNKLYNLFRRNGISSLREIYLDGSGLGPPITIPDFTFIEKIRVRDGVIYFMYRDNVNEGPMMLYRMIID